VRPTGFEPVAYRLGIYRSIHLALCGFEGIYKLCSENPELQEVVQKFAQNNVRLADNDRLEAQKTRLLEVVGLSK
jgi:hypothetical protein